MALPRAPRWIALSLLAGGVAFAFLGWRALALEQAARERHATRSQRLSVARGKADAERLAQGPRGRPLARWRIEPATTTSAGPTPGTDRASSLRRAAAEEGTPERALALYQALRQASMPDWVRRVAASRMGLLFARLGRMDEARVAWTEGAGASPFLVGVGKERTRMLCLRMLALDGLRRGDTRPLATLLDQAEDGSRLTADGIIGPGRTVRLLAQSVADEPVLKPEAALAVRLQRAATHAEEGLDLLDRAGGPGAVLHAGRILWRSDTVLALFPIQSLMEPPLPGFESGVVLRVLDHDQPSPPGAVRLDGALQRLAIVPVPVSAEPRSGWLAAWALAIGLLAYGVGAAAALAGWRRSRRAQRQQAHFTAAVSHEMKTPIASVRAMAELLADGGADDRARTQRYMERIEGEMQRLGTTVRNVLDAANIERGSLALALRPTDPADLVERVGRIVRPALERRGFTLLMEAAPATGALDLDAGALEGVLMNLLDNAAKFSPGERHIELRGAPCPAGGYRISVADRGVGLDGVSTETLFERYVRGAAARAGAVPGVGLGLHIAQQVVDAHGGRLRARPRPGGGALFEVDLPGEDVR